MRSVFDFEESQNKMKNMDYEAWIENNVGEEFWDSYGKCEYIPWDESEPQPTGKCQNCGEYVYDFNYFCSDACARAAI